MVIPLKSGIQKERDVIKFLISHNFWCIARNVVAKKWGIHKNGIELNAHFYFGG